jgi:KDO2-lipid IV(A) lauroyltransferase
LFHYYEKIFNAYSDNSELIKFLCDAIKAPYLEKLDHGLARGKGVLFVTGHYGAIEYIPFFLALKNYPVSAIGKFSTAHLKSAIVEKAEELGLRIIDGNRKREVLCSLIKELRANRIVFTQCDEMDEWRSSRKRRMFFLGKAVGVDRTIDVIKKRTDTEVVFGILHRNHLSNYTLLMQNLQDIHSKLNNRGLSSGEAILKYFETFIYSYPDEWYQWKKYSEMGKGTDNIKKPKETLAFPMFKPIISQYSG